MKLPYVCIAIGSITLIGCGSSKDSAKSDAAPAPQSTSRLPGQSAKHVELPAGTTSFVTEGKLPAGENAEYVISGKQSSLVMIHAFAPGADMKLVVYRMDNGQILDDEHKNSSFWKGRLPATLGYLVEVQTTGKDTEYALEVEVPRTLHLEPGKSSKITSWAPPSAPVAYIIPRAGDRTLIADLKAAAGGHLTLSGLDEGDKLVAAAANARTLKNQLSAGQDYILRVYAGDKGGDFTLTVSAQ